MSEPSHWAVVPAAGVGRRMLAREMRRKNVPDLKALRAARSASVA